MRVNLAAANHPTAKSYWLDVASYQEASRLVQLYIARHDLGAGCADGAPAFIGGEITDNRGRVSLAQVSYNGRVWAKDGKEIKI